MSDDRVTNKQLYDELQSLRREVPSKTEMRLTVCLAVIGGSSVASIIAAVITRTGPVGQAHALAHLVSTYF